MLTRYVGALARACVRAQACARVPGGDYSCHNRPQGHLRKTSYDGTLNKWVNEHKEKMGP